MWEHRQEDACPSFGIQEVGGYETGTLEKVHQDKSSTFRQLRVQDYRGGVSFYQLFLVHQLWLYLDRNNLAAVVHALITLTLDYCNGLHMQLPLCLV